MTISELAKIALETGRTLKVRHEQWDHLGIPKEAFFAVDADGIVTIPGPNLNRMLACRADTESSPHWYEVAP